jgi:threonine dehydrogenase-like Zn-dependent dehydrogenase
VEAFANLAKTILADASLNADDERLTKTFVTVVGRMPSDRERRALRAALATSRTHFNEYQNEAVDLIASGKLKLPESIAEQVELVAFTSVAQIVMNTDEFLTRE